MTTLRPDPSVPRDAVGGGVACAHCGLPVPPARRAPDGADSYCCDGCRVVAAAIRGCGLERFYAERAAAGVAPRPARVTGRRYAEFDDARFHELHVRPADDGRRHVELYLEGIHCGACLWLLERLPRVAPGVVSSRVHVGRSVATIVFDPAATSLSEIARRLGGLGYPPPPCRGRSRRSLRRREDRAELIRIAVAGAVAANVMVIAFALYGGMFHGMEPAHFNFLRATSLGLALVALAWPGRMFLRGAWGAVRARRMNMDVPIAIGLVAGMAWSAASTLRGTGEVYFDSLTVLIFLLLAGRALQRRRHRAGYDAVEALASLTPGSARRLVDGGVEEIPIESVLPGDRLEVRAGESIPADGVVRAGRSAVDLSLLTGESRPEEVEPERPVWAGTVNLGARLEIEVAATGEETRVGRLMRLVERSAAGRAPIVQLADRVAGWFVAAVVLLAALTVALWWRVDPSAALAHGLALLVVTCPCALGLATPLAVAAAVGRAARRGILVKTGEALQRLGAPAGERPLVILDKTGTLTEGRLTLTDWWGDDDLKPMVAAAERQSAHPVARALVAAFDDGGPLPAAEVRERTGGGLRAVVDGRRLVVGSRAFLAACGLEPPPELDDRADGLARRGRTPVLVALDGRVAGLAGFGDPVRADAGAALDALRERGWDVGVLSGDHAAVVDAVARELGIDPARRWGGVTPEGKLAVVERARAGRTVVMVGDGVNDAAALAAATVGVAVRGGAEASLEAAEVYLAEPGLGSLVSLARGARRTMAVIRRNLGISLAYNTVAAGAAVAGLIDPLVAAILMPASSLTVITLSYRSRTFDPPGRSPPEPASCP
ncbi:MAG: heavy metal translocating P-type ATPase [Planctomycetota bacterium]|jgi:Cu2+-exporting ATPase